MTTGLLIARRFTYLTAITIIGLALLLTACDGHKKTEKVSYTPTINSAEFTSTVDNPFLPLKPGTRTSYDSHSDEGNERIVVEVTRETKTIMGVRCLVVRDTATKNGAVTEDTFDWYAQDREGNVWYFGEDTKAYEKGKVSTKGSWEAGVDGAQPGIVMKAQPQVGEKYRQEYLKGTAEDAAEILSTNETAKVPYGSFENVIKTKDYSALEPDVVENKYYARGIGVVLEVDVKGGSERVELVKVEQF